MRSYKKRKKVNLVQELRKSFGWVKEKIEKGEIHFELEHDTVAKKIFERSDDETKTDYFLELFIGSLFLLNNIEVSILKGGGLHCRECGKTIFYEYDLTTHQLFDYVKNQGTHALERGKCEVIEDYSFEIAFPTGEIICSDRLPYSAEMFEKLDETTLPLHSNLGIKERTLAYAHQNICHVFVGNTSPDVFKKEDVLVIGHATNNEDGPCSCGIETCECDYMEYPPIEKAIKIAKIWTDLWWASLVDQATYQSLLIDYYGQAQAKTYLKQMDGLKIKIKPGIYRCTYFQTKEMDKFPPIHATLTWIREYEC